MGIKDLIKLIKSNTDIYAMRPRSFHKFHGWRVAVDASLMIHMTVTAMRLGSGKDLVNDEGDITTHLHGIFYKILTFLETEITPIFVFDGKPAPIKTVTCEARATLKKAASEKMAMIEDQESDEYRRAFSQSYRPSRSQVMELKIMLDLMGIPYIDAPQEADPVCAWLTNRRNSKGERYANGVCSDDSDMIPLGARYLLKDMCKFMGRNKMINIVSYKRVLVGLNLSEDQLIDLCVILGTDYCKRIKGIGEKRALGIIRRYKTLEAFLQTIEETSADAEEYEDIKENIQCMRETAKYFRNALSQLDDPSFFQVKIEQLVMRKAQSAELLDFLCIKHGFDVCRIQSKIDDLVRFQKAMKITRPNTGKYHVISGEEIVPVPTIIKYNFISDEELEEDDNHIPRTTETDDDQKDSKPPKRRSKKSDICD
jgi:flap endonuclease-1